MLIVASDITGELKVSMHVVPVCELEEQELGRSVIDKIQDFDELMHYFNRLNDIINACRMGNLQAEDISFLKEAQVSEIAIEASARLFCTEEAELVRVMEILKALE